MTGRSTPHRARRITLGVTLVITASALGACGSDQGGSALPDDCRTVRPGADGTSAVTVVGKNLAFDVDCLAVQPGKLVVTFDNQDGGTAHDFHVTGHGVNGSTALTEGVTSTVLTVELTEPGRYTFACDPHASMEGTLVVLEPAETPGSTTTGASSG
ncbi:hypothetical protein BH10ACT1_BH10ACT1_04860 [soil metagenome]